MSDSIEITSGEEGTISGLNEKIKELERQNSILAQEITLYKTQLESYRESESTANALLNTITESVILIDKNGIVQFINDVGARRFGKTVSEVIGRSVFEFFSENAANPRKQKLDEVITKHIPVDFTYERDGHYFHVFIYPVFDNSRAVTRLIIFSTDVTEQIRAEEAIRVSEERYRNLVELSPDAVFVHQDGIIIFVNHAALKLLGGEKFEELLGKQVISIVHPDFRDVVQERINNILKSYVTVPILSEKFVRLDGTLVDVEVTASIFKYRGRDAVQVIARDISEREKAMLALRDSEQRYRALFENNPHPMYAYDQDSLRFLAVNEAAVIHYGYTRDEFLSMKITDIRPAEEVQKLLDYLSKPKEIYTKDGVWKQRRKDGSLIEVEIYRNIVNFGRIRTVIALVNDITERKRIEEELKQSETFNRTIIENSPIGISVRDKYGRLIGYNDAWQKIWAFPDDEIERDMNSARRELKFAGTDEYLNGTTDKLENLYKNGGSFYVPELRNRINMPGSAQWVSQHFYAITGRTGEVDRVIILTQDITERKHAVDEIRKLSMAVEQSPASIIITDTDGNIEYVNPKFTRLTGYSFDEVKGKNPRLLKSGYTKQEEYGKLWQTIRSGKEWQGEFRNKKKNGELYWEIASITPIKDEIGKITHFLAVKEDITEKKIKDEQIMHSLIEKELMLREIHHRVKNNLQVISSLLKLQSGYIKDPQTAEYFNISQNRIKSMALIHQQLYGSKDLSHIDFGDYLQQLTRHLLHAYISDKNRIKINIDTNNIYLGIDTAIPCGLLINEVVSNSLKHAFPDNIKGTIAINMYSDESNKYNLIVKDNGVGFPKDINYRETNSLGMQIIVTLAEQLDAKLEMDNNEGTTFGIKFRATHNRL